MPDKDQNLSQEQDNVLTEHDTTIRNANLKANRFYHQYTLQSKISFWATIVLFIMLSITAIFLIGAGVYMAFDRTAGIFMHLFSVGACILGFVVLIILLIRNPIKLVQKSQNDLFKINIIYTSFNKQMTHLDAAFKKLLSAPNVSYDQLKQCTTQTRSVVDKTLEVLYTSTEDLLD